MMNSTTNEDWDAKRTKKVDLLLFLFGPSPEIFTIVRKKKQKQKSTVSLKFFYFNFFFILAVDGMPDISSMSTLAGKKNMTA